MNPLKHNRHIGHNRIHIGVHAKVSKVKIKERIINFFVELRAFFV
jgi:hypothetical protein